MRVCPGCEKKNVSGSPLKKFCTVNCRNVFNVTRWRQRTKLKLIALFGSQCSRCGYKKCVGALSFHHKDKSKKEFGLSLFFTRAWKRLVAEAKKCDLLCANCHAEEHYGVEVILP